MSEVAANAELGKGVNLSEPTAFLGRRRQRKRQSHSIIQNSSENDDFDSDSLSPPNVSMFSSSDSVPFETKTSDLCNEDDEERPTKLANLKENPEIHSFRIVNAAADATTEGSRTSPGTEADASAHEKKDSDLDNNKTNKNYNNIGGNDLANSELSTDAVTGKAGAKYVLMCFICKLSFGETKSFFQHAKFEHKICDLKWKKEFAHADLENAPRFSAIIQKDASDSASVCFLEPMSTNYNYETLLKGTKIEIPSGEVMPEHNNKLDAAAAPDLGAFFKEETLKHRKLSEALQSVMASNAAVAAEQAAADEKNNMLAVAAAAAAAGAGGAGGNINAYLFELCRQIYGGGLPPMLGNQNNNSSKTEIHNSINNQQQHQDHDDMADDKTPNNSRHMQLDPSEMCEVKIKEEHDSLTPIKFESPELAKSPLSIKADRNENGYSENNHEDNRDTSSADSMTSNLLAMYQTMAGKRAGVPPPQALQQNIPKEMDALSTLFCPEHKFAGNGQIAPDCKNCAIVNLIRSSMKSPPPSAAHQQNSSTKVSPNSSFTIGMCPDHLNGRPLGVECMRCEMILNSSRMAGGHSAVTSSTRNSCKTLKCPQCNWHYKYQETLEIHMREKHPDGESACAFCLAGQQHPRLARGESYTCGYKPYRCEICNYSTTTKGNLSIHMQSDKHLNNMQELSNQQQQQQIVDVEPLPLSKTPQKSPPPHMAPSSLDMTQGVGGGQVGSGAMNKMSSTMKPNFRCDVCSYETSVARNLRIHMTSEKHIQNMTALQQNIKQYQFMKQTPPANIMQQLQSCLPEQAIADYSYNQALLIKLLQHQNQMGGESGMNTPQPDGGADQDSAMMDEDEMAKSEGTSGGNTSMDQEQMGGNGGEGNNSGLRSTDSNNNAENKDLSNNRKTPDSQNWFENDETRGSDCSSNADQYGSENRYSDPQRPYKCDVCQESFTQKSILLVHFNSVSHINRIKKQLPGKSGSEDGSSSNSLKRKLSDSEQDSPKKRFKCDICKVAYAQGSTLDIHMRSVLHQTRTCRMNQEQQMRAMQNSNSNPESKERPSSTGPLSADSSAHIYKTLLENFGFDVVKQFNEIDTKLGPQAALDHMYKAGLLNEEMVNNKPLSLVPEKNLLQQQQEIANEEAEKPFFCRYCNKSFNSVFVLKSHYEEVHNDSLQLEAFGENNSPKKNFYKAPFSSADDQVIDFSNKPKDELISPKRNMTPSTPDAPMVPPVPSFEEQQMLQKHLQTMNMLSLMNQNRVNGDELQGPPAAGNFDLLNLLQFHQHLLSLNFMNLAPPLMINNNVQQQQQQNVNALNQRGASMRPEQSMEESLIPPSFGNAFMAQNNLPPTNQKRARTRITDDQLKILRSHFDINNSPSEESIMEMSKTANLPMKVVKHWFRNTLFKERQKNKDSPYNFNNPPSTTLNLEEYERTGQAKSGGATTPVIAAALPVKDVEIAQSEKLMKENHHQLLLEKSHLHLDADKFSNVDEKSQQSNKSFFNPQMNDADMDAAGANNIFAVAAALNVALKSQQQQQQQQQHRSTNNKSEMSAMSPGTNVSSMCNVDAKSECESITSGCSDLINSTNTNGSSQPHSPNDFWSQTPSPIFQQNAAGMDMVSGKKFKSDMGGAGPSSQNGGGSMNGGGSSSMGSSGKRANRTRFTDYQIKVLQEFFENNSYPKDSDLEYLSKMLLLSPRVIVVWFQNARQKQRKIYENQPNNIPGLGMSSSSNGGGSSPNPSHTAGGHGASPMDSPTSSVYSNEGDDKTKHLSGSNISYTCKKCSSVFQRYYELIRHQKNHCFKEENNKKSAKAQIAAAQIAQQCLANPGAAAGTVAPSSSSDLDSMRSKSPKSIAFPGVGAPSQQHLAAIMAAAAMAVANDKGSGGVDFAAGNHLPVDAMVDKEEHMDMVRNLTAILGSVANNQTNDCPPLHLPGAPEQYNLPPSSATELKDNHNATSEQHQGQNQNNRHENDQMCNKLSLDDSYSNASEASTVGDKPSDDALIQNPSTTQQPCPSSTTTTTTTTAAGLPLFIHHDDDDDDDEDSLHLDSISNQHLPKIKLQTEDQHHQQNNNSVMGPQSSNMTNTNTTTTTTHNQATKRLRTTITPEQLHFLYDCYQQESNPSRKMLEQIAKQVNLKKRVVQVWYQNSRARERKGQYRTSANNLMSSAVAAAAAGNLMMDSYVGSGGNNNEGGSGVGAMLDSLKSSLSPSSAANKVDVSASSPAASDLGFLFNTFKQHY